MSNSLLHISAHSSAARQHDSTVTIARLALIEATEMLDRTTYRRCNDHEDQFCRPFRIHFLNEYIANRAELHTDATRLACEAVVAMWELDDKFGEDNEPEEPLEFPQSRTVPISSRNKD